MKNPVNEIKANTVIRIWPSSGLTRLWWD